jgi:hypothetical protein
VAWPFVVALILFADRDGWRRAAVLLAPVVASIAVLFRFNQIMGHMGRFYVPFLPFFVAAGGLELDAWLRRGAELRSRPLLWRAGVAAGAAVVAWLGLLGGAGLYAGHAASQTLALPAGFHVPATTPLPDLDSWQAAHAIAAIARDAPEATFAMSEHGLPGAIAPATAIVDVLGLHDPGFARDGFSAAALLRRKPDLIWLPHEDHTAMLREIVGSEAFWAHYAYYPDAFFHGIAVRTDGPYHDSLSALVAAQWQAVYPGHAMADHRAVREP